MAVKGLISRLAHSWLFSPWGKLLQFPCRNIPPAGRRRMTQAQRAHHLILIFRACCLSRHLILIFWACCLSRHLILIIRACCLSHHLIFIFRTCCLSFTSKALSASAACRCMRCWKTLSVTRATRYCWYCRCRCDGVPKPTP